MNRTVKVSGVEYRYQVYVPAEWSAGQNKGRKWPVLLFLHGSGERGSDGLLQTQVGIGKALREHADRWPFIAVMPQCRENRLWVESEMLQMALATLDAAEKEFHGDRSRVYVAGLSMGGYGVWQLAARAQPKPAIAPPRDQRFAAYVVICGGVNAPANLPELHRQWTGAPPADPYLDTAQHVGSTPVWIFHGEADTAVPTEESRKMAEALKAIGAEPRYTEYPKTGHNSWDKAFAEPELPQWLLAKTLSPLRH